MKCRSLNSPPAPLNSTSRPINNLTCRSHFAAQYDLKNQSMSSERQEHSFDLERFRVAQEQWFGVALSELHRGKKESHWIWFIFPQLKGLGGSALATHYGLESLQEARAFLEHPTFGPRLIECCRALLSLPDNTALEIMGSPDDLKLRSSMTLFALAADGTQVFQSVLDKFYGGQRDPLTLELLQQTRH